MTFSIAARCQRTGQIGIAATTAVQAVGKLACHAVHQVGAFASQALLNPYLAYDGLRLLQAGASAQQALDRVIATDPRPQDRQAGVVDNQGRTAAWTGTDTLPWSGHRAGRFFTTQGNRLAGPQVLDEVIESMHATEHLSLAERLVLALQAGAAVGGDIKGERSCNVMVFSSEEYPLCDIRIDEHEDAMGELSRLWQLYVNDLLPTVLEIPTRQDIPRPDTSGLGTAL
jgi:uncharacterized Ntn-hydrolase superfamily protein